MPEQVAISPSTNRLLNLACFTVGVTLFDLLECRRSPLPERIAARDHVVWLMRHPEAMGECRICVVSYQEIAQAIGLKSHSTVCAGEKRHEQRIAKGIKCL